MNATVRMSESLAVVGLIQPAALAPGETLSTAIDLSRFHRVLAILETGTLGAAGTLDMKLVGSATSGGTYTLIPGHAITQVVKATGDGKVVMIEARADWIGGLDPTIRFIKVSITVGVAASTSSLVVLGGVARWEPSSDYNLAAVAQIVAP